MMLSLAMGTKHAPPKLSRFSSDDERWEAVRSRNRAADEAFYYSVQTTGVYCRPSCPARLPRRENVRFHTTRSGAERAGFRPCKRCRPNEPALAERQAAVVAKACRLIEEADEMPSLEALADTAGMSRFHFHRIFKAITGLTPKAFADAHRARRVRDHLTRRSTVTEAIYGAGFNSNGRFYAASSDLLGMTPTEFRAGGKGTVIRFAAGECSLGSILVAATDKGVCAIEFGDDPDALVRGLQDRFPKARLIGGDDAFERLVAKVVGFVEAPAQGLDLPLDIRGTAFQQRVWQAIRDIPLGSTASYAEIARRIDRPKAVRAVAQACASNAIALGIPCHRIVRTDGTPSGYRWGVERKRALLKREAAA
jgi:AraC family transcriptional regulator, regulatory protein of adaptative response / methylated-DNA-[protein]-cysteine methyltransferase